MQNEPHLAVGIQFETEIKFAFNGQYKLLQNGKLYTGANRAQIKDNVIEFEQECYTELTFEPLDLDNHNFDLLDVTIGINFHWQRKENQRFPGALKVIVEHQKLTAINVIPLEQYLESVISSEMSATSSVNLLKAHAVISRSWLVAQLEKRNSLADAQQYISCTQTDDELVKWYDREDHTNFDVCADDHCQRYQGITRASTSLVSDAVNATRGELLTYDGKICDARFSKCCGGVSEEFENCWEPVSHPYLKGIADCKNQHKLPVLTDESNAVNWIRTTPEAFCNTQDKRVLSQVLNNYDQETADFFRWKKEYTQTELSELILKRSGIDFGQIKALIPLQRGVSGRITRLKVVGSKRTLIIGKELEIRRSLSETHLYSSAFVTDYSDYIGDIPGKFTLTGAGWGHGVGLCQIGAAVMSEKGYDYKEILRHYFTDSIIEKQY